MHPATHVAKAGVFMGSHSWLHAIVVSLLINLLFIALLFTSNLIPQDLMLQRIRDAFVSGDLTYDDYLPYDTRRGYHQYNDCNILQMIANPDTSLVGRALGPWTYSTDTDQAGACRTLYEVRLADDRSASFSSHRYTRYWHGYIPIISALLVTYDIATVRTALQAFAYMAVFMVLLAGIWKRWFFPFTAAVGSTGALFWGLPYFGQGFSHALGDSAVMLGIASLIFWHRRLAKQAVLFPFCALFGALIVYFEMLTGPLPIGAGFVFTTVYLISRLNGANKMPLSDHFKIAICGLMAFGLGATLTLLAKLALVTLFVQPTGIDAAIANIDFYTRSVTKELPVPGVLQPLGRLLMQGKVLTYGNTWGLVALYSCSMAGWVASAWIARRSRSRWALADFAAFAIGAASVPVWTLLLPTHTFVHAPFMTRILIVPISFGWAAFLWQMHLRRECKEVDTGSTRF